MRASGTASCPAPQINSERGAATTSMNTSARAPARRARYRRVSRPPREQNPSQVVREQMAMPAAGSVHRRHRVGRVCPARDRPSTEKLPTPGTPSRRFQADHAGQHTAAPLAQARRDARQRIGQLTGRRQRLDKRVHGPLAARPRAEDDVTLRRGVVSDNGGAARAHHLPCVFTGIVFEAAAADRAEKIRFDRVICRLEHEHARARSPIGRARGADDRDQRGPTTFRAGALTRGDDRL